MRPPVIVICLIVASGANANWFSSSDNKTPTWSTWNQEQLKEWLGKHGIQVPKAYTQEQLSELVQSNWYAGATWTSQQVDTAKDLYKSVKEKSFDSWSESQLRDFLVKQGVVAPSGPREQLALLAKKQYRAYNSAVSSLSAAASTAVYGDKSYQASQTASIAASSASSAIASVLASGHNPAQQTFDDTKDYVYSTWSDNKLREYLEDKGFIDPSDKMPRDKLLTMMKDAYSSAEDPVWNAWSDSYMYDWLHSLGVIRTPFEKKRAKLTGLMSRYYYDASETIYSSWNESQLKAWLVEHNIIKPDAMLKKDKLLRLVSDNYASAQDTIWGGWKDSDIREWLIERGYLRSDAQVTRDELVKLINDKYTDMSARTASYLTWPDARLRAYLRAHGVDDAYVPTSRPDLLHEVRIRWVQTNTRIEAFIQFLRDKASSRVELAEERLNAALEMLTSTGESVTKKARDYSECACEKGKEGSEYANEKSKTANLKNEL